MTHANHFAATGNLTWLSAASPRLDDAGLCTKQHKATRQSLTRSLQSTCSCVPALPEGEQFTLVAAGSGHTAAVTSLGRVLCWGGDLDGQCSGVPALPEGEQFKQCAFVADLVVTLSASPGEPGQLEIVCTGMG